MEHEEGAILSKKKCNNDNDNDNINKNAWHSKSVQNVSCLFALTPLSPCFFPFRRPRPGGEAEARSTKSYHDATTISLCQRPFTARATLHAILHDVLMLVFVDRCMNSVMVLHTNGFKNKLQRAILTS